MITYQTTKSRNITVALVAAIGVAAAGGYWYWSHSGAEESTGVVLAEGQGGVIKPTTTVEAEIAQEMKGPPTLEDGRPSDVSPDDWNTLKAALAKQNAPKGEAERIVSYLRYQKSFENWQQLDQEKDAQKRRLMAQRLLAEIPERMGKGEFSAIEGQMMSAVLLTETTSDEGERTRIIEDWQRKLAEIASPLEDEKVLLAKAREVEFKRRQANAFSEWQDQTNPAERTAARLDQAFEGIRRAYNSGEF
ncbi:MAG: hypothetical protein QM742_03085 [Aquabacterium sp.]